MGFDSFPIPQGDAIAENYSTGIRTMLPANGKAELLSTGLAKTTSWNSFAESTQGFDVAGKTAPDLGIFFLSNFISSRE